MKLIKNMSVMLIVFIVLSTNIKGLANGVILNNTFDDDIKDKYIAEWYCSDWNDFKISEKHLETSAVVMLKKAYKDYMFECDYMSKRGSHMGFAKSYIALRQPAGYGVNDNELVLLTNDNDSFDKNGRPGVLGIFLGLCDNQMEMIVHVTDETKKYGVYNEKYMFDLPVNFRQTFVKLRIIDKGNTIEIYAENNSICKIVLGNEVQGKVNNYTKSVYSSFKLYDSANKELLSIDNAVVPVSGTIAFLSRTGDYIVDNIKLEALSGNAVDADDSERIVEAEKILRRINEEIKPSKKGMSTTIRLCIIISVNLVTVGIAVVCFMITKRKIKYISLAVVLIGIIGGVLIYNYDDKKNNRLNENNVSIPDTQKLTKEGNSPQIMIPSYNQTATDALGRTLPGYDEVGDMKEGKYVGMFYCLWTMSANSLQDNSKFIARNPDRIGHGPYATWHWWGEPETGYHTSLDEWQVRRDLYYLSLAGIDYIYLDFTNGSVYDEAFRLLLDTSLQMRKEGTMTPYIVPWVYADNSGTYQDAGYVYRVYYAQEQYADLWFYLSGKPLMLLKRVEDNVYENTYPKTYFPVMQNEEISEFFTFRMAWVPSESDAGHYPGEPVYRWSWCNPLFMHNYKEDTYAYSWDKDKEKAEQITIIVGGYQNIGGGRSGNEGILDKFHEKDITGEGAYLQYQYDWVMKNHPEVKYLNISGWNEWIAQYYDTGDFGFVDSYNREFSRDIEPMKGGFTDNYYYQMCAIVRKFKGMRPPEVAGDEKKIDIDGAFSQWDYVTPVYTDFTGDTVWRDSFDTTGTIRYINHTGRNDITESRVTYDMSNVYFYVETSEAMTSYTDKNWMLLFIDSDNNKSTGWEGYDYLVNLHVVDDNKTVICAYQNKLWQEIGLVKYKQEDNKMHIAVPRKLINQTDNEINLQFHWLDNVTDLYSLYSWFTTGDSAPERRNNYIFKAKSKYDVKYEEILPGRKEGLLTYMEAVKLNKTAEGLIVKQFKLNSNYGKQPEIDLLDGDGGNLVFEDVTNEIALVNNTNLKAYALLFEGYIEILKDGYFDFSLTSDDGAMLYIDDRLIIDNGGPHKKASKDGTIGLCKGYHKIRIEYFENGDGNSQLSFTVNEPYYFKHVK